MSVSSIRQPITLGDFLPPLVDEPKPKSLHELFRVQTRLTNQLHSSKSRGRIRKIKAQLKSVDWEIAKKQQLNQNTPAVCSSPSSSSSNQQEENTPVVISSEPVASSSSQAPQIPTRRPLEDQQIGVPVINTNHEGQFIDMALIGTISAIAFATLGIVSYFCSGSNGDGMDAVAAAVKDLTEKASSKPTRESSLSLIKSIRDLIKADPIVNSWSPSVRRAFNRAIDDLIRSVNRGKLLESLSYEIGTGRSFWGIRGTFNLICSWFSSL